MNVALALVMLWQTVQAVAGGQNISEQIVCAPMSLPAPPVPAMRIVGGYVHGRLMFGPGEPLVINAGSSHGIKPGQQYFVRRYINDRFTPASVEFRPNSIHTAGWVTIITANDRMSVATVTHACDGVVQGDYLEPYVDPIVPAPAQDAQPDFAHPGRIVMADERRQMGYPGLVMLLNRGSDDGVRAGQAITIYRETLKGEGPTLMVGAATVLSVYSQASVVRIDSSRDAIFIGDLAAIHRITQ
ncbi:MAG TPA: hypothetical protein VEL51_23070 [Vicinamibacterales bacterium]|nr:hypothetical protein [Vicinamibacterales bacterium]